MKNITKNAKRLLSLVLSLCIVAVSLAGAIVVSAEDAVASTVSDTGLIAGGNMEDLATGSKAFAGWGNNSEVVETEAYTGAKSLHLKVKENGTNTVYSGLKSVTDPEKTYLFSAYLKINSLVDSSIYSPHGAPVYAKFQLQGVEELGGGYCGGGNHLLYNSDTNGEWVRVSKVITGAAITSLVLYVFSDDAYVDDISLIEYTPTDTGLIANGNMESFNVGGDAFSGGYSGTRSIVTTEAHTGAKSMRIGANDIGMSNLYGLFTEVTNPEKTYLFSAYIKLNNVTDNKKSGADVIVKFAKASGGNVPGNYYSNHKLVSGVTDGWVRVTSVFTGADAKDFNIQIYSTDAYIDDVSLVEITLPDTGLIAGGHIENDTIGVKYGANDGTMVVNNDSYSGEKSVHIEGTSTNVSVAKPFKAPTDATKTYLFSAYIKVNSVNTSSDHYDIWVQFYDANGSNINNGDFMSQHKLYIGTTNGEWVRVSKYITGVEAYGVYFFARSNDTYLDDISMVEIEMPDTGLIVGGHMETTTVGSNFAGTTTGVVTNTDAYSGENSLYFGENAVAHSIYSGIAAVTDPAKTYLFSAYIKVNSVKDNQESGADIYAKFDTEDRTPVPGNNYNNHTLWSGTTNGEWVKVSTMFTGANVKYYALYLYSNDAYVDDISLIELDLPNTGLVANGHFEMSKVGDTFGADFAGDNAVVDTEVYAGEKSLKLGGEADYNVIHQDFTAVTDPAKTYMFSAWVKINNVAESIDIADMFIQLYKEDTSKYYDGKYYHQIPVYTGTTNGEWVKIAYTFNGVAAKGFELHAHSTEVYIDDISVVALEDTAIVPDGSFEYDSCYRDQKDYFSLDTTVAHTGTRSLKVTSKEVNPDVDDWREDDKVKYITVDPTKTYRLKVWAKADVATDSEEFGALYLKYTEADDSKKYKYFDVTTEWAEYDMVISQLNKSEATARIALGLGVTDQTDGVTVWFDDLSVEEIPDLYTHVIPTISTGKLGETFFVDDASAQTYKFDLNITNDESYDLTDGVAVIDIYNYATDKHISRQIIGPEFVAAGETVTKHIRVYGATEFGTYRVAITLKNDDFTHIFDRFFTVAKTSNKQNSFLAINEHHIQNGGQEVHDLVADAGFGWVAMDIIWSQNVDENGNVSFLSGIDTYLAKCEAENLKVRANITLGDFVADTNGNGFIDTTAEAEAFGDFCAAVAAKYAGKIDAYEIISEYPCIMWQSQYLENTQAAMQQAGEWYAWLLKEAYTNIKAADAAATVVLGAMNSSYYYNAWLLDGMLYAFDDDTSDGDEFYFDAFGIHPYTNPGNPMDVEETTGRLSVADTVAQYQAILDEWELDVPIWLTEVGFSSATEGHLPNTIEEQTAYLMQLYLTSRATANVEFLSFYNLQSGYGYTNTYTEAQYGITGYDTSYTLYTKPAYAIVNTMANLVGDDVTFVSKSLENGVHKFVFRNANGKYITAVWVAGDNAADVQVSIAAGSNASALVVDSFGNETDMSGTAFVFNVGIIPMFVVSDSAVGAVTVSDAVVKTAPVLAGNYSTYIEVVAAEGYEYSIDGIIYSAEAKFEGLNPNTVYTVFCKDTATGNVGTAKFRTSAHGDLDGNCFIQGTDLTMMGKILFNEEDPEGTDVDAKDVNGDGNVDIIDLVALKKLCLAAE